MGTDIPRYVPEFSCTKVSRGAVTYHLQATSAAVGGWVLATINDHTGELLIMSDYGNWSHRWGADPRQLGAPTLTHFIADRASCHYLADKLVPRERRRRFHQRRTVAAFRKMLCERRLEVGRDLGFRGWLTADLAREIWDDIGSIDADDATLFCERFMQIDGYERLDSEPWESLEYEPTAEYMILLHGVLPALVRACFAQIYPGRHRCDKHMARGDGAGHWRDFHRGHKCHLDPDPVVPATAVRS